MLALCVFQLMAATAYLSRPRKDDCHEEKKVEEAKEEETVQKTDETPVTNEEPQLEGDLTDAVSTPIINYSGQFFKSQLFGGMKHEVKYLSPSTKLTMTTGIPFEKVETANHINTKTNKTTAVTLWKPKHKQCTAVTLWSSKKTQLTAVTLWRPRYKECTAVTLWRPKILRELDKIEMDMPPTLTKLQLVTKNDVMRRSVESNLELFNFFIRALFNTFLWVGVYFTSNLADLSLTSIGQG